MAELKITLIRSPIGFSKTQKRTVQALGLRKLHKTVFLPDNPQIRGMVKAVSHLVTAEPVTDAGGREG
jgi:large subunit ribosomal protein L30